MTSRVPKFHRSNAVFLDPDNCGSSIRWEVERSWRNSNNVCVELRDCDETIRWSGYNDTCIRNMRKKLTMAIVQLRSCLTAIDELEHFRVKRKKK